MFGRKGPPNQMDCRIKGGFNRSSQHHALGGVDDDRKTEVGSVYAAQTVLARSAAFLSIGIQLGPLIGVRKGPLWRDGSGPEAA